MAINDRSLREEELLDPKHNPIINLFCCAWVGHFVNSIKSLAFLAVMACEVSECYIWDSLSDVRKTTIPNFHGIKFIDDIYGEAILEFDELYYYMDLVVYRYIVQHPETVTKLQEYLSVYRKNYLNDEPANVIIDRVRQRYHKEP